MIEPRRLARTTDPVTSHLAAADVAPHLGRLQGYVLGLLRQTPDLTGTELAQAHGIADPRKVNRRLSELERAGLAVRGQDRACQVTGKRAQTWRPAPDQLSDGSGTAAGRGAGSSRQYEQQQAGAGPAPETTRPPGMLFDVSEDASRR